MKRCALLFVMVVLALGCSRVSPPLSPSSTDEKPPSAVVTPTPPLEPPGHIAVPAPVPSSSVEVNKPETVVWAQKIGEGPAEELYRFKDVRLQVTTSPDGQYIFSGSSADDFGHYTPHILDRNSGTEWSSDTVVLLRPPITWSGKGFWIAPLPHFGVDGNLTTNARLQSSLTPDGWELIDAAFSPDSSYVAALIHKVGGGKPDPELLDLVIAKSSGEVIRREPNAVAARYFQRGFMVNLIWSPDSSSLAVCAVECRKVSPQEPSRDHWGKLPDLVSGHAPQWSMDGTLLLYPGLGVVGPDGRLRLAIPDPDVAWNATGTAVLILGQQLVAEGLDGRRTVYGQTMPPRILGWLPDGRMLTVRYP